jgi:dihydrolipoamide dehydrogenase
MSAGSIAANAALTGAGITLTGLAMGVATTAGAATASAAPTVTIAKYDGKVDSRFDLLVLGAGPGGYSAAFRAADLGLKVVLVERYSTLGGVCLNVGCIPSKALLHTAAVLEEAQALADHGISFGKPKIDLDKLRAFKDGVIGKLTGGLAGMAKARKVTVVTGVGSFVTANHVSVQTASGVQTIEFAQAIIAAGSQSVKLPFMPDDERVVDSTGALLLRDIPKKMLIVGGGIIGLEMGTIYSALGSRLDVVEMQDGLMQGADRDLVKVWQKKNAHRTRSTFPSGGAAQRASTIFTSGGRPSPSGQNHAGAPGAGALGAGRTS